MTPLWTAAELVEATHGTMTAPFDAGGVSIDTRTLAPGELFVALRGEQRRRPRACGRGAGARGGGGDGSCRGARPGVARR